MFSIYSHLVPLQAQAQAGETVQALVVQNLTLGVDFMYFFVFFAIFYLFTFSDIFFRAQVVQ